MGSSPAHLLSSSELFSVYTAPRRTHLGFLQRGLPFLGFSRRTTGFLVRGASTGGGSKNGSSRGSAKAVTKKKGSPWNDEVSEPKTANTRKSSSRGRSSAPLSSKNRKGQTMSSQAPRLVPSREWLVPSRILVSGVMPVEMEKVLQTQEPSTTPSWPTFVSSLCGVWRGVGAAFSPATAEMEAISLGDQNEMLYDCRILSTAEEVQGTSMSHVRRKTVWIVGNPLGEQGRGKLKVQEQIMLPNEVTDEVDGKAFSMEDLGVEIAEDSLLKESDTSVKSQDLSNKTIIADLENPEMTRDTVMEEDVLELEPGLVFFEDGSYSRGPLALLNGDSSDLISHTYKIEQCLVRGGHSRLRLVHTIAVEGGGESVQLLRVAVYIEEWMGPNNMKSISDSGGHHLKLFSQLSRLKPQELTGTWRVFELSATAIVPDDLGADRSSERPPYVYMSMETEKRRLSPELPVHFADEDIMDIQDVTVMWLPGGISAYVDVKEGGTLTVGVGWYDDGVNLVMERDYNTDGKLCEVHSKSEIKGGWVGGRM
eukprot:c23304_g1_i1 orf=616-2226(-)